MSKVKYGSSPGVVHCTVNTWLFMAPIKVVNIHLQFAPIPFRGALVCFNLFI